MEVVQHPVVAIGMCPDAIDEIGPGQAEHLFGDRGTLVVEQVVGFVTEELDNAINTGHNAGF